MIRLHALHKFPKIIRLSDIGTPYPLHGIWIQRIQDCIVILNRIISRWDNFHAEMDMHSSISGTQENIFVREEQVRIEVIEDTFSFITFLFLLIGFYRGLDKATREAIGELSIDPSCLIQFPVEKGTIYDLRVLRNKMIAHTAHIEPRGDDTLSNRYAYLTWYVGHWGVDTDLRNRRLNTFGVGVDGESSTQAIPPEFDKMITDVQLFIDECELVATKNVKQIVDALSLIPTSRFVVLTDHPY